MIHTRPGPDSWFDSLGIYPEAHPRRAGADTRPYDVSIRSILSIHVPWLGICRRAAGATMSLLSACFFPNCSLGIRFPGGYPALAGFVVR